MTKILSFPASSVAKPPKIIEGDSIVSSKKKALKLLRYYFKSPVSASLRYSCYSGEDGREGDPTFLICAGAMNGWWHGSSEESWIGAAQDVIRYYENYLKIMGPCK